MENSHFMPAREEAKKSEAVIVTDIDALLSRGCEVRLHGKAHALEPVTTLRYLEYVHAVSEFAALEVKEGVKPGEVLDKALLVLNPIIPTITKKDLEDCTQPQLAALFSAVRDQVQGRFGISQKKN